MEKAAVTGSNAGNPREFPSVAWAGALFMAWAFSPGASAQEAAPLPAHTIAAGARTEAPMRVQVQTSSVPRLEGQDSGFQGPRVDVSLFPANARGLGAVIGLSGSALSQPQAVGPAPNRTSVDLGVRWSHKLQNQNQIDVTAWRRIEGADDAYTLIQAREPVYGARVEMNIKPVKLGMFGIDRGFVGLQLESGARISLKRKDGRPMVYYRTAF